MRTVYLNNSGSRWINLENGKRDKIAVIIGDKIRLYSVKYYSQWGNFCIVKTSIGEIFSDKTVDVYNSSDKTYPLYHKEDFHV